MLCYIALYLMHIKLETALAEIPMRQQSDLSEIISVEFSGETLFPKNGPAFIHRLHRTSIKPKRKSKKEKIRKRKYGNLAKQTTIHSFLVDNPKLLRKSYDSEADSQNQTSISTLLNKPGFTQNIDNTDDKTTKKTKSKEYVDAELVHNQYDDTTSVGTITNMGVGELLNLPLITEPLMTEANDNIYSTLMEGNINSSYGPVSVKKSSANDPVPTTDPTIKLITIPVTKTFKTTPRADLYALFTVTRNIFKKLNEIRVSKSPKPTNTTAIKGYKLALAKIFGNKVKPKYVPIKKKNGHFIDVYDYIENFNVTMKFKRKKNVTKLKPTPACINRSLDYKQTLKTITIEHAKERYAKSQSKPDFMKNLDITIATTKKNAQRFRVVGNRKSFTQITIRSSKPLKEKLRFKQVNDTSNALATSIIRFKVPLDKLASMKVSFNLGHNYPAKTKENVTKYPREVTIIRKKEDKIENGNSPQRLRDGYLQRRAGEKVDNTGVTESNWTPTLIETISTTPYTLSYVTAKQDNAITNAMATANERFKLPLQKLASMKADFDFEDSYSTEKYKGIFNKSKVNFDKSYPISRKGVTEITKKELIEQANTSQVVYFRTPAEIGFTETESKALIITKGSSTPNGISDVPSKRDNAVTNVIFTAKERFKVQLQKLSSMKASFNFGRDHAPKKENKIKSTKKAETNFKKPLTSTEKAIKNVKKESMKNTNSPPEFNTAYFRAPIEKLNNFDVTEFDQVPPWIKTVSQTTVTTVYPWLHTRVFSMPMSRSSTPAVIYEYKELKPEEVLRIRPETEDTFQHMDALRSKSDKPQIFPNKLEKKVEESATIAQEEVGNDPFSIFLVKLTKILASKNLKDLQQIVMPFGRYVTTLLDKGKLIKLGLATGAYIATATTILRDPIKDLQRQLFIIQISLENRRKMLDEDFNAMLDEMDDAYDVGEEEAMQRVLKEITEHPNSAKTGEQIVQGFIDDVLLHPMNRIAGTAHGNVVFENIAKVAMKNNPPVDNNARRNEVITNKHLFNDGKRNRKLFSEEHKFVNPVHGKEDIRYNKLSKNQEIIIRPIKDSSKDEDSSNNGLEIKIQINNRKHSNHNDINLQANTENNEDLRRHPRNLATTHLNSEGIKLESSKTETAEGKNDRRNNKKDETKVKLQFDCEPVPVDVSNKRSATKDKETDLIMYCSNASNSSERAS